MWYERCTLHVLNFAFPATVTSTLKPSNRQTNTFSKTITCEETHRRNWSNMHFCNSTHQTDLLHAWPTNRTFTKHLYSDWSSHQHSLPQNTNFCAELRPCDKTVTTCMQISTLVYHPSFAAFEVKDQFEFWCRWSNDEHYAHQNSRLQMSRLGVEIIRQTEQGYFILADLTLIFK